MSSDTASVAEQLWLVLRYYLRQTCGLFGEPSDIARALFITRREHKHMCEWLRPIEALLRRLLFLLALTLPRKASPKPVAETKTRAPREMKAGFGAPFEIDKSENWRVSFNVLQRPQPHQHDAKPTSEHARAPYIQSDRISAANVAMRLEAAIRVTLNPTPYAEKVAQQLAEAEEPPLDLLTVPRKHKSPLYEPARDAAALIRAAIFTPAFADSS